MTILTTIVLTTLVIIIIPLLVCWFATTIITSNAKTPAEAAVRGLYYLARRLRALAEGADAFLIGYRDVMRGVEVSPNCEHLRRLEEEKAKKVEAEKVRKHTRRWKKAGAKMTDGVLVGKVGLGTRMLKFVFG
jgi:hypothetical protein